jgi:hypothetical protein
MLKRLAGSGINIAVLVVAVLVFVVAVFALNGLAAAQKPPTVTVLAAAHNIPLGGVISSVDLVEKTVYQDSNSHLYVSADQADSVLGGVAALPIFAGQPLYRNVLIAPAAEGHRLSAALGQYPDHSLFPLPLDANNVVAPKAASFLPGDLIGITVVIGARPQPPLTPTPAGFIAAPTSVITTTAVFSQFEMEKDEAEALDRAYPPLAKDLFPQGALVIEIQGLPQQPEYTGDDGTSMDSGQIANDQPVFSGLPKRELLVLLIPNESREELALAMQRADQVFVSLLAHADTRSLTPGFTYWDLEDLFKADRQRFLKNEMAVVTPTPSP